MRLNRRNFIKTGLLYLPALGASAQSVIWRDRRRPADLLTNDWVARVIANGGAKPSNNTIAAVDNLYYNLYYNSFLPLIITCNIFAPDNLIAALTPQVVAGTDPWGNTGFVLGDLSVNGLHPTGSQFLDPGVIPAARMTDDSLSLSFYDYLTNVNVTGTEFGVIESGTDSAFTSNFGAGGLGSFLDLIGATCRINVATPGNGFYLGTRIASNDVKTYFASSVTSFASVVSGSTASTPKSAIQSTGFLVFATNNNGSAIQGAQCTTSWAMIGKGFNATQGQNLYNAVQTCRVALGGGFR